MELDKEREILKDELEKTTAVVGRESAQEENQPINKVGPGIRTYSADIADIMRREKGSIIKIALAEQERRKSHKESKDPTSTRNLIILLFGVTFIVAGILIFVYTIINKDTSIVVVTPLGAPSLIYTENQTQIDMTNQTRGNFYNDIHTKSNASYIPNDTITNLFLVSNTPAGNVQATASMFFNKLGIRVPDSLLSVLTGQFMLGVYKKDDTNNIFLILKTKGFNETFPAMKEWEISMANDLVRLFRVDSQSFDGNIFNRDFESTVLFNKQARNLYDASGKLVFSYVYLDNNTIIITTNNSLVEEVIKRINSQSIR